jgi:hypothetical protein
VVLSSGTLPLNKAQARSIIFLNFGAQTVKRDPSYALHSLGISSWPLLAGQFCKMSLPPFHISKPSGCPPYFLSSIDSEIELDNSFLYPSQREHDFHIMDRVLDSGKFKPREVRLLNYCRLFLGVTTISDVPTANGKDIDRTMFLGTPSLLASQTKWMQPEQAKPYAASWGHLHQPLGWWLLPGPSLGRNWTSYLTKRTKQLILAKQGVY